MKLLTILFTTLAVILTASPQDSPELKEAAELMQSVVRLMKEQKPSEALPLAKRALEIREKLLPRTDPLIGNGLVYLVDIYTSKRDFGKAKETLQRLLQHQTERFGPEHVKLTPALERLAVLHFRNGDNTKADDAYKRAVALKEKEYGTEAVEVAHTLFGLAELYRARRDFDRASEAYRRTLTIYGTRLGVNSPDFERTGDAYHCLGFETKNDVWPEIKSITQLLATPTGGTGAFSGILNGKAISLPAPEYPERARENRLSGFVAVKVTIDESGTVVEARDLCGGPPYLSESSVKAAYKARFTPTTVDGKPIRVYGVIRYNFVR